MISNNNEAGERKTGKESVKRLMKKSRGNKVTRKSNDWQLHPLLCARHVCGLRLVPRSIDMGRVSRFLKSYKTLSS